MVIGQLAMQQLHILRTFRCYNCTNCD